MRFLLPSILVAGIAFALTAQDIPPTRRPVVSLPAAATVALAPAEVDLFIQIAGIPGEATDSKFKDWIDVQRFGVGATQPASSHFGSGGGAGKVDITDLTFAKRVDSTSPKLFLACASGAHFSSAILAVRRRSDGAEVVRYTLTDVLVSGVSIGSAGGAFPTEEVSINFSRIVVETSGKSGPVKEGWDLKVGKKA